MDDKFSSFSDFYLYYLEEHSKTGNKALHFIGTFIAISCLFFFIITFNGWYIPASLLAGYGFAWFGHYFVEKNRPATFKYPLYSFLGDLLMFWQILLRKIRLF